MEHSNISIRKGHSVVILQICLTVYVSYRFEKFNILAQLEVAIGILKLWTELVKLVAQNKHLNKDNLNLRKYGAAVMRSLFQLKFRFRVFKLLSNTSYAYCSILCEKNFLRVPSRYTRMPIVFLCTPWLEVDIPVVWLEVDILVTWLGAHRPN